MKDRAAKNRVMKNEVMKCIAHHKRLPGRQLALPKVHGAQLLAIHLLCQLPSLQRLSLATDSKHKHSIQSNAMQYNRREYNKHISIVK